MTDAERQAYRSVISGGTKATRREIIDLRKTGEKFYVLKFRDELYIVKSIKALTPYLTSQFHLCQSCRHCLALPSESGGCDKVLELNSSRIYKYPFIRLGVESYNRGRYGNSFVVTYCKNYHQDPVRKSSPLTFSVDKKGIARFDRLSFEPLYARSTPPHPGNLKWNP